MMERVKEFVRTHTPRGRYEEYMAKHASLIAQAQGQARYALEQSLDADAKRYARRKVALDVLALALLAGGAAVVIREVKGKRFVHDVKRTPANARAFLQKVRDGFGRIVSESGKHLGSGAVAGALGHASEVRSLARDAAASAVDGAVSSLQSHAPVLQELAQDTAGNAGESFVQRAALEATEALPPFLESVKKSADQAAYSVGSNAVSGAIDQIKHRTAKARQKAAYMRLDLIAKGVGLLFPGKKCTKQQPMSAEASHA